MLAHGRRLILIRCLIKQHARIGTLSENSPNRPRASPSVSLHFRFLSLPLAPPLLLASACGARCGSVRRKDSMSASTSSPPAGEEKQEVAPVRHCKGVNDLDKVVLREVQGNSAEVPVYHSHKSPGMFRLPDPDVDPQRLPWCCSKPDFPVAVTAFPSRTLYIYVSSVSDVSDVCYSYFILMLQK